MQTLRNKNAARMVATPRRREMWWYRLSKMPGSACKVECESVAMAKHIIYVSPGTYRPIRLVAGIEPEQNRDSAASRTRHQSQHRACMGSTSKQASDNRINATSGTQLTMAKDQRCVCIDLDDDELAKWRTCDNDGSDRKCTHGPIECGAGDETCSSRKSIQQHWKSDKYRIVHQRYDRTITGLNPGSAGYTTQEDNQPSTTNQPTTTPPHISATKSHTTFSHRLSRFSSIQVHATTIALNLSAKASIC